MPVVDKKRALRELVIVLNDHRGGKTSFKGIETSTFKNGAAPILIGYK